MLYLQQKMLKGGLELIKCDRNIVVTDTKLEYK